MKINKQKLHSFQNDIFYKKKNVLTYITYILINPNFIKSIRDRQGQHGYKSIVLIIPRFSYDRFYRIKVKIFSELIIFRLISFYKEYQDALINR